MLWTITPAAGKPTRTCWKTLEDERDYMKFMQEKYEG